MSLDHLWAGWRGAYVSGATEESAGCVLCRVIAPGDDRQQYVVARRPGFVAVLNVYPYTSGHVMVVPVRHVGELEELGAEEASGLWGGVTMAVRAVKDAYQPGGVNVGINLGKAAGAGLPGHLHVHVLPRWDGDTSFMTAVAEVRVLPEALSDTWDKLQAAWPTA